MHFMSYHPGKTFYYDKQILTPKKIIILALPPTFAEA